ncbi:MAG: hypothetical protein E7A81_03695 [Clostridiales bacterium]|nr:hypothetical protein [Clostridiales bacterium]MDU1042352.1 hypothetical protein [Clostridiales bacterium]
MKIWIILAFAAVLIVIAAINSRATKAGQEKDKNKGSWGRFQSKKYPRDDYDNISHYAMHSKDRGFYVDDITWNDLEMDDIFRSMDCAQSSIGREYVYKSLRMPEKDKRKLKDLDSSAEFMSGNEGARLKTQSRLSKLGFVHNFSFSDYLDTIQTLRPIGSGVSIILDILLIASIIFAVTKNAPLGVIFIIGVSLTATAIYFKKKPEIEPYFICLSQVSRMVRTGNDLLADRELCREYPEVLSEKMDIIERSVDSLKPCTRGDWLIADSRSTGSPAEVFMNYIRMFTHVDIIHYNSAIKKMQGQKQAITDLMETFGFIEMSIVTASYREALPYWSRPEFTDIGQRTEIELEEVFHPLIEDPIANSITLPKDGSSHVLLTGSNASGKSTFLKAVAINAILSQTMATALAVKYRAPMFRVYSSMSLRDDLKSSGSYYMVEIKALKRILDAAEEPDDMPVLCFVDEVLRGTNTIERIAASSAILNYISKERVTAFAATHDIELTGLLKNSYANYHFREEMTENGIEFSYKLFEGPATTRNAIALLDNLGYDEQIIKEASVRAGNFAETGIWR